MTRPGRASGFTVVELVLVISIIATLGGLAIPAYTGYVENARVKSIIVEMKGLADRIDIYEVENETLPNTLADIGEGGRLDPWGNPYVYKNLAITPPGQARKDQFLVPLNSDYDLYSKGKDGASVPPLTAASSKDDILRANDGNFYGLGEKY